MQPDVDADSVFAAGDERAPDGSVGPSGGVPRNVPAVGHLAEGDHEVRRLQLPAEQRSGGGVRGIADNPEFPGGDGTGTQEHLPDSDFCARDKPGLCVHVGNEDRDNKDDRTRRDRPAGPGAKGQTAREEPGGGYDHLPFDLRSLRGHRRQRNQNRA